MSNTLAQNPTALSGSSTTSIAKAFTSANTNGSQVIAAVTNENKNTIAISDSAVQSYTSDVAVTSPTTFGRVLIASVKNTSTSTLTVTATFGAADHGYLKLYEITGQATSSVVDATATADASASITLALGSLAANDTVIACGPFYSNTITTNVDSGFTADLSPAAVNNLYHTFERKTDSGGAGSLTLNWGGSAAPGVYGCFAAVAYKTAGAGGSTGTLAKTNANDTSAASGTTTVLGTLAKINANDTSVASGTTTVLGALAKTNANDTVVASGSVGSAVSGTLATTNANDTSVASGTTTIVGTLAKTNSDDSIVASGWASTITGTLAYTNNNDTSVASGAGGPVTDVPLIISSSGVKKKPIRVRRSDFSSQKNYEVALKAAIAGQFIAEIEADEPVQKPAQKKPKIVVTDTAIKVSAESLLALQKAAEMEEMELIKTFIEAIESEYGD